MKKTILFSAVICALLGSGCDSNNAGSGGTGGVGSAALSLELKELSAGEHYVSADGVLLDFTTFALAFSEMSLGGESVADPFAADFFDEETVDVAVLEGVPAGEYDDVTLTLGTASGLGGAAALQAKNAAVGADVTSSLNGKSAFIVANAINGGAECTLRIELVSDAAITVDTSEADVDVTDGAEAEVLVRVDPGRIFGTVSLASLCTDGADVTISSASNPSQAASLLNNLVSNGALALGSTEGHAHVH